MRFRQYVLIIYFPSSQFLKNLCSVFCSFRNCFSSCSTDKQDISIFVVFICVVCFDLLGRLRWWLLHHSQWATCAKVTIFAPGSNLLPFAKSLWRKRRYWHVLKLQGFLRFKVILYNFCCKKCFMPSAIVLGLSWHTVRQVLHVLAWWSVNRFWLYA